MTEIIAKPKPSKAMMSAANTLLEKLFKQPE